MSLNWPIPSFVGEQYTYAGSTWEWNGEAWESLGPGLVGPTGATGASPLAGLFGLLAPTGSSYVITNEYFGSGSLTTYSANVNRAFPVIPSKNLVMTAFTVISASPTGGSEVKLAMYEHDYVTAQPKNRIISSPAISTATSGDKTWSTGNVNLNAGEIYWFSIITNSNVPTFRRADVGCYNFAWSSAIIDNIGGYSDNTSSYSSGPASVFTVSGVVSNVSVLKTYLTVRAV